MRYACLVVLAAALPGCAFFAPLPKQIWLDQYKGVAQLPDSNVRLNALANVTESAAYDGDAAAVKRFLKDFRGDPRHDDLAAKCAAHLVGKDQDGNDKVGAEEIAELIDDPARRAETLAKLRPKPEKRDLKPDSKPEPALPKTPAG